VRIRRTLAESGQSGYSAIYAETPLKVTFGRSATWTAKSAHRQRRGGPHPIWRGRANRAIFPAHRVAGRALRPHPVYPEEPSLQYQRIAEGSALPAGSGPGTNRNHRAAALQRRVSLPGGLAGVSGRDDRAALLAPVGPCWTEQPAQVARHLAGPDDRAPHPRNLRPGQHGADGLWPSGTSRGGLQPQEARAPLLPSPVVLRGEHAGLLGGQLPSRRHPRLDDHDPVAGACLRQIARADWRGKSSSRWSVL